MDILEFIGWAVGILVVIVIVGFIGLLLVAFGTDFFLTLKNSDGWVWQERKGTAVMKWGEEKDGCISFVNVWGKDVKTCGIYQIEKYSK